MNNSLMRKFAVSLIAVFALASSGCNSAFFLRNGAEEGARQQESGGTHAGNPTKLEWGKFSYAIQIEICAAEVSLQDASGQSHLRAVGSNFNLTGLITPMLQTTLPDGTYSVGRVLVSDSCGTGYSIRVTNPNGTFTLTASKTVVFNGPTIHPAATGTIEFQLGRITEILSYASSVADVDNAFTNYQGGIVSK